MKSAVGPQAPGVVWLCLTSSTASPVHLNLQAPDRGSAGLQEGQTLSSRTWRSSAPSSWPASWRKLPVDPQEARASSPSVVWTWWTPTPPAQALACVAQAVTGTGPRTGPSAASAAGTEPTTAPSAEAPLPGAHACPRTGTQGCRGGRAWGAPRWQPPSSWGRFSSARASSSPWPRSSTSSVPVGCLTSSMEETKPPACSLAKLPR
ncbi:uncharacterized protein C1orf159 homolog isoform X9 [Kogia breviceps]|uniref:uncharacterized protein C1orf159 homolog isoform X9 n=1 Tax=Kogia breviceps TaxID=27615 RepID=UPI0034D3528A